jgi:hypothetical protein
MVLTLERAGLIRRQPGLARSIEVLVSPERLPLLRHPQPVKTSAKELAVTHRTNSRREGRMVSPLG